MFSAGHIKTTHERARRVKAQLLVKARNKKKANAAAEKRAKIQTFRSKVFVYIMPMEIDARVEAILRRRTRLHLRALERAAFYLEAYRKAPDEKRRQLTSNAVVRAEDRAHGQVSQCVHEILTFRF